MNIETIYKLVDLRNEINKERAQEITVAEQDYLDTISNARQIMKDTITSIKTAYRQAYADKKTELIAENEVEKHDIENRNNNKHPHNYNLIFCHL